MAELAVTLPPFTPRTTITTLPVAMSAQTQVFRDAIEAIFEPTLTLGRYEEDIPGRWVEFELKPVRVWQCRVTPDQIEALCTLVGSRKASITGFDVRPDPVCCNHEPEQPVMAITVEEVVFRVKRPEVKHGTGKTSQKASTKVKGGRSGRSRGKG